MAVTISPSWGRVAPQPPTSPVGTGGNAQVSVAFVPPVYDGGGAETSYLATSTPGSFTQSGAASPQVVTGLTNGTAYTFTVTATNAYGTSALSAASGSVTPTGGGTTLTIQIAAVADNSEMISILDTDANSKNPTNVSAVDNGLVDGTGPTVLMPGEHAATNSCNSIGLMFHNVTVPQGTTITSATLTLYAGNPYNSNTGNATHFITVRVSC